MTLCTDPVVVLLRSMEMQVSKYDLKMASRLQRYMKMILKPNKTKSHPLIIPKIKLYMLMILSLAVSLNMRFNIMLLTAEVLQLKIRQLKQCYLLVTSFLLSPAVSLIQLQKL